MTEPERLIAECDKTLQLLRESWMDAKPDDKLKWMNRINILLEERHKHMVHRDNFISAPEVSNADLSGTPKNL